MIVKAMVSMGLASFLVCVLARADDTKTVEETPKTLSGMSVLGNNDSPKSLTIVPWKSSELGDGIGIDNLLDDRAAPVDKVVFLRELSFYRIRTGQEDSVHD